MLRKNKVSVLVTAKNEEKQIAACLKTLDFADEIILILDSCTDKTEMISKKFTNQIFKGSFAQEGERRNYGISKCNYDWIFEIDADERVTKELQNEILITITKSTFNYHQIPVNNYIGKKLIKYGWGAYFGKSAYIGLFKKGSKIWGEQKVHPRILLKGKKGDKLKNPIKHYYCKDISDMFTKLNNYSDARCNDIISMRIKENLRMNLRRVISRFWKCFILRKGYREGRYGFLIALIASLYPILSFLKSEFKK
tara:strand:+ start:8768 stop:9526 length:759 start_codon:yes stop_codon:yes gene_type:complete